MLGTMLFGMFFLLSLYQQDVLGFSALRTGVGNLAIALTVIVAAAVSQALVTRVGVKPVLMSGLALLGAGMAYYTQISVNGSYVTDLLPGFLMTGVGLGFSFVPISIAALGGVTSREAGLASGLINTSQQIGGGIGLAILTTVATTLNGGAGSAILVALVVVGGLAAVEMSSCAEEQLQELLAFRRLELREVGVLGGGLLALDLGDPLLPGGRDQDVVAAAVGAVALT